MVQLPGSCSNETVKKYLDYYAQARAYIRTNNTEFVVFFKVNFHNHVTPGNSQRERRTDDGIDVLARKLVLLSVAEEQLCYLVSIHGKEKEGVRRLQRVDMPGSLILSEVVVTLLCFVFKILNSARCLKKIPLPSFFSVLYVLSSLFEDLSKWISCLLVMTWFFI